MSSGISWNCGLRIVDLSEVAKQMQCKECSSLLDLKSTRREDRMGLASILFISCRCGVLNEVHTSGYVKTEMGRVVYSLNAQLASSKKACTRACAHTHTPARTHTRTRARAFTHTQLLRVYIYIYIYIMYLIDSHSLFIGLSE